MKLRCKVSHQLRREIIKALNIEDRFVNIETGVMIVYGDITPLSMEIVAERDITPEKDLLSLLDV